MTTATGNFAELLWPGIHAIYQNDYEEYPALYPRVFTVEKSDKAFEKVQGATGLPLASVKDQGGSVNFVNPFQGYQKEYVMVTYAIGSTVTKEMWSDDQYGYINKIPSFLARSMRQTEETVAWAVINNAFTGGSTAGPDGVSLINTAHPLVGGGTASNRLATDADLSQTSLETLTAQLMDAVDEHSLKMRLMPKTLIAATANNWTGWKLMETDAVVGNADNDKNPMKGLFKDYVISPWISDPDAWFIQSDMQGGGLRFWNRWDAELERDNEFSTKNLQFSVTRRFDVGFDEWRDLYGTNGA